MADDTSLDVTGLGKLAKAIPAKAWTTIVDTACATFRDAMAPFTATTSGIGRLIEARFDRLVDAEKVLAAANVSKATQKAAKAKKPPSGNAKASIVIAAIQASGCETDSVLRELWSNLLAQELVAGSVHPEFPHVLSRLSSYDARILAWVGQREKDKTATIKRALASMVANTASLGFIEIKAEATFNTEQLIKLNLIQEERASWSLTHTGRAFIQAVSDPSLE